MDALSGFLSAMGAALFAGGCFLVILWTLGAIKDTAHHDIEL